MIFVMVGTHLMGFDRLVKKMDDIAQKTGEKVVIQRGNTKYIPQYAEYFDFIESDQAIKDLCKSARVVVTQGGMAIMTALEQGRPVIATPRLKKYGEHANDHQIDIIKKLEAEGKIIAAYDINDIDKLLLTVDRYTFCRLDNNNRLVTYLKNYINQIRM